MSEFESAKEAAALADFPLRLAMPVRWGEMDAYEHLNNAVYPRYFEEGRMAFFVQTNVEQLKAQQNSGPILAGIRCRYRYPVTWPDTLVSALRLLRLERTQVIFEHCIYSRSADCIAASGRSDIVWFDYAAGRRMAVPDLLREQMLALDPQAEQGEDQC